MELGLILILEEWKWHHIHRAELQKEVDQLAVVLTDISIANQCTEKDLLTGEFEATFHVGVNEGQILKNLINYSCTWG